ncbi:anthrax toxin-like adenylyl cyclase domain-containing protein [Noviherbaspirillum saxi]|uniref:Anthrax toxin edema factor central domain-containing protein n=1 Tax=Noviherbaspirillum saxi TaxID=2320863 RepID=A0A3A3FG21_9BURK|nr:anthrax toxin-like adenylyl cyclase domain-containing protein [Noviherbaspirillum saxi]RJF92130.1 hypothetical protein D3871_26165 [Noviherbaspirillum saxi]
MLRTGKAAESASGLVLSHIEVLKELAKERDVVLAFRKVNPHAKRWIEKNMPVKGLSKKTKTEKRGLFAGLMVRDSGGTDGAVSELDGPTYARLLKELIDDGRVHVLQDAGVHETGGASSSRLKSVVLQDLEHDRCYKISYDPEGGTISVFRKKKDGMFRRMKFEGHGGKPLTADYDAFDFYPRLVNENFAGFKDIDMSSLYDPDKAGSFRRLVEIIIHQVLELPEVRSAKAERGRLTAWDNDIINAANARIKKNTGYTYDVLMHGKEKRNSQYPELCDEVFFIFPDGMTLMSKIWNETQAVDYAIRQEGFISTDNRVYNRMAGEFPLFPDLTNTGIDGEPLFTQGSGKVIPWDSRAAAKGLYDRYLGKPGCNRPLMHSGLTRTKSDASVRSMASVVSVVPDWLEEIVDHQGNDDQAAVLDSLRRNSVSDRPPKNSLIRSPRRFLRRLSKQISSNGDDA